MSLFSKLFSSKPAHTKKKEVVLPPTDSKNRRKNEQTQVERNLQALEYEKSGKIEAAIKLYEQNVAENFDGNLPYDNLSHIYRTQGKIDDEIRVLQRAVYVFENLVSKQRSDRLPKLEKFQKRLAQIQKM